MSRGGSGCVEAVCRARLWGVGVKQWEEQLLVSHIGCSQPTEPTGLPPALLPADYKVAEGLKGG